MRCGSGTFAAARARLREAKVEMLSRAPMVLSLHSPAAEVPRALRRIGAILVPIDRFNAMDALDGISHRRGPAELLAYVSGFILPTRLTVITLAGSGRGEPPPMLPITVLLRTVPSCAASRSQRRAVLLPPAGFSVRLSMVAGTLRVDADVDGHRARRVSAWCVACRSVCGSARRLAGAFAHPPPHKSRRWFVWLWVPPSR